MTSHFINDFARRTSQSPLHAESDVKADCAFCLIVSKVARAHVIYETEAVIPILDILPIRPGHTLVIPKRHISKVSELPDELAGQVGKAVSRVADALVKASGNPGLNIVCNQEYAQAVPHVHYHVVPAPPVPGQTVSDAFLKPVTSTTESPGSISSSANSYAAMLKAEFHNREALDGIDADNLTSSIRQKL